MVAAVVASACASGTQRSTPPRPAPSASAPSESPRTIVGEPSDVFPEDLWIPFRWKQVQEKDPVDPDWAPRTENVLRARFAALDPANARLKQLECRRKVCLMAFIVRPPLPEHWPKFDWAGFIYPTQRERSDGWFDVALFAYRHPEDHPGAVARIDSTAPPTADPACANGVRRAYSEDIQCPRIGRFGADIVCFGTLNEACACACARMGRVQSCRTRHGRIGCVGGGPALSEWSVELMWRDP